MGRVSQPSLPWDFPVWEQVEGHAVSGRAGEETALSWKHFWFFESETRF